EVVGGDGLECVVVCAGRADVFSESARGLVTLRAVERFDSVLPVAARLVAPSGRLALFIGEKQSPRVRSLAPGFDWMDPLAIPLSSERVLLVGHREYGA